MTASIDMPDLLTVIYVRVGCPGRPPACAWRVFGGVWLSRLSKCANGYRQRALVRRLGVCLSAGINHACYSSCRGGRSVPSSARQIASTSA
jgi:hypothetical protein